MEFDSIGLVKIAFGQSGQNSVPNPPHSSCLLPDSSAARASGGGDPQNNERQLGRLVLSSQGASDGRRSLCRRRRHHQPHAPPSHRQALTLGVRPAEDRRLRVYQEHESARPRTGACSIVSQARV